MKLALFGHGRMARAFEAHAAAAGHEVGAVLTSRHAADAARLLAGHDVAIDFSVPGAVLAHVEACAAAQVPLVEGTTGWQAQEAAVRQVVAERHAAVVYGANFSIGVNVFYRIVTRAAELLRGLDAYAPFIEEAHHAMKRDAPSGTALVLKDILVRGSGRGDVSVASTRAPPRAASTVSAMRCWCSGGVSVAASPVVPHGTSTRTPPAICPSTRARNRVSSMAPVAVNGVTSAVPQPRSQSMRVVIRPPFPTLAPVPRFESNSVQRSRV